MAFRDFKGLPRRTASDKVLCDKAFNIASNPKYNECHCRLALTVYKFLHRKSTTHKIPEIVSDAASESQQLRNKLL